MSQVGWNPRRKGGTENGGEGRHWKLLSAGNMVQTGGDNFPNIVEEILISPRSKKPALVASRSKEGPPWAERDFTR